MTSKKIETILAKVLKIRPEELVPQKRIVEDLGADSLHKVECIMSIEETFSIDISDDEARSLTTVEDIINHVERKLSATKQK